jgi:hypothetical protein
MKTTPWFQKKPTLCLAPQKHDPNPACHGLQETQSSLFSATNNVHYHLQESAGAIPTSPSDGHLEPFLNDLMKSSELGFRNTSSTIDNNQATHRMPSRTHHEKPFLFSATSTQQTFSPSRELRI